MKRIVFPVILLCCYLVSYAQSERSNELYARGVELYKTGKFKEAIPLFTLCDSLDRAELDSTSNRRGYSVLWLANCYYQTGDTATAAMLTDFYSCHPVDRRLTIASDSLAIIGKRLYEQKKYDLAYQYYDKCRELETAIVGVSHHFIANDYISMADCKLSQGDTLAVAKCYAECASIAEVSQGIPKWYLLQAYHNTYYYYAMSHKFAFASMYISKAMALLKETEGTDNESYLRLLSEQDYALCQLKDWKAAAQNKEEELSVIERMNSRNSQVYITNLNTCGVYHFRAAEHVKAAQRFEELVILQEKNGGLANKQGLQYLQNLNHIYEKLDSLPGSVRTLERMLPIIAAVEGKESISYLTTLTHIAQGHLYLGDSIQGVTEAKEAIEELTRRNLRNSSGSIQLLNTLGQYYKYIGNFVQALHYLKMCKEDIREAPGIDTLSYAQLLIDIGSCQTHIGAYTEALHTDSLALKIYSHIGDERGVLVALNNIGVIYSNQNNYEKSAFIGENVMERRRLLFGEKSTEYAFSLANIAYLYSEKGDFIKGITYGEKAISIYQQIGKENSPNALFHMGRMGLIYYAYADTLVFQNERDSVLIYLDKALSMMEKVYGKTSINYAQMLMRSGEKKHRLEFNSLALKDMEASVATYKQVAGEESDAYTTALQELVYLSENIDERPTFVHYAEEYYAHCNRKYGKEHAKTADACMKLGNAYWGCGDARLLQSEMLHREGLQMTRRTAGPRSKQYAYALLDYLEDWNVEDWTTTKQLTYAEEAYDILKEIYGDSIGEVRRPLSLMAGYHAILGHFDRSIEIYEKLLKNRIQEEGNHQSEIVLTGKNLCSLLFYDQQGEKMMEYAPEVHRAIMDQVKYSFSTMTEFERSQYWEKHANWFMSDILSCAKTSQADSLLILAYDAQLFAKGLLLNTETNLQRHIQQSGDTMLTKRLQHLNELRTALTAQQQQSLNKKEEISDTEHEHTWAINRWANYKNRALKSKDSLEIVNLTQKAVIERQTADSLALVLQKMKAERNNNRMKNAYDLQQQTEKEERELILSIGMHNQQNQLIRTQDVAAALLPSSAAIEFVCFKDSVSPMEDERDSVILFLHESYYALVLKTGQRVPQLIRLCAKDALDTLSVNNAYTSKQFTDLIWGPLKNTLTGIRNIYFSPTGKINHLAIEHMPDTERWNIYRLSSTRELVLKKHHKKPRQAVLYGGLQYDIAQNTHEHTLTTTTSHKQTYRDMPLLRDVRGAIESIPELPGSMDEVKSIGKEMKDNQLDVSIMTEEQGTEESFKSLSGQPMGIVHISTHGFYEKSDNKPNFNRILSHEENQQRMHQEDLSLSRSGLILSGGSESLFRTGSNTQENGEDGILTAREISHIDLSDVNLVTLSACETGLGDITSEGVFGLQRGFKKAGVQSILMSLWKVDDEATCLLMTEFYKNWIGEKRTKHEALELAKQAVRSHKEKGWDNPKYWAAFILLDALD